MESQTRLLPQDVSEFKTVEFWDGFFEELEERTFEWYCKTTEIWGILQDFCTPDSRILHPGCGNSSLPIDLYDNYNIKHIVNIDFSETPINEMLKKVSDRPELTFLKMDILNLEFDQESFDIVLDKSLHDAMMETCDDDCRLRSITMFNNIHRVLKPNGKLVMVSLAQEHIFTLLKIALSSGLWGKFEINEVVPSDPLSSLLPFVFIFTKSDINNEHQHTIDSTSQITDSQQIKFSPRTAITIVYAGEIIFELQNINEDDEALNEVYQKLEAARNQFVQLFNEKKNKRRDARIVKKLGSVKQTLYQLDVKPWDETIDLSQVLKDLPRFEFPDFKWIEDEASIVPLAFGICKISIKCVITGSIDIEEVINELTDQFDGSIQSIDVVAQFKVGELLGEPIN